MPIQTPCRERRFPSLGERQTGHFFGLADALLGMAGLQLRLEFWFARKAGLQHGGFDGGGLNAVDSCALSEVRRQQAHVMPAKVALLVA